FHQHCHLRIPNDDLPITVQIHFRIHP
ncbi:unnamed protein product, partial [Rotaria sp. Silwood2]